MVSKSTAAAAKDYETLFSEKLVLSVKKVGKLIHSTREGKEKTSCAAYLSETETASLKDILKNYEEQYLMINPRKSFYEYDGVENIYIKISPELYATAQSQKAPYTMTCAMFGYRNKGGEGVVYTVDDIEEPEIRRGRR